MGGKIHRFQIHLAFQAGRSSNSNLWIYNVRMNQMPEPGCSLCLTVSMSARCQSWTGPDFGKAEEKDWEGPFDPQILGAAGAAWLLLAGDPRFARGFPFPWVKRSLFHIPWAGLMLRARLGGHRAHPQSSPRSIPAAQTRLLHFQPCRAPVLARPDPGASCSSCSSTSIGFGAGEDPRDDLGAALSGQSELFPSLLFAAS